MLELKVGSYNIRFDTRRDQDNGDGWKSRLPVISSILQWEEPDVFGIQEPDQKQLNDLQKALPQYQHYGLGRADGKTKGEFTPVFYKKERFSLLNAGVFWLSPTPDQPGKGWDAKIPRICTWVKLLEKYSSKAFWVFNVHFDHAGTTARLESSRLMIEKITALTKDESTLLIGDFNVDQNSQPYRILHTSDHLTDAFEKASQRMAWNGTINAFDGESWTDSRIDHIFVSPNIEVSNYAILTESYRSLKKGAKSSTKGDYPRGFSVKDTRVRLPSDHFPVFAKVQL